MSFSNDGVYTRNIRDKESTKAILEMKRYNDIHCLSKDRHHQLIIQKSFKKKECQER
jgi:hypothetical protein